MTPYEQQKAELETKFQKEREDLEKRHAILSSIPEGLSDIDWAAYPYRLYDRAGSLHARHNRYESIRKHPQPTLDTAVALWEAFPAVNVSLFRDGSVGVRTADDAERQAEKRPGAVITPIAPVWVELNPGDTGVLCWVAEIAGQRINCHVELPLYSREMQEVGSIYVNARHDRQSGEVVEVIQQTYTPGKHTKVINNSKQEFIRYASGSRKTAGKVLAYWNSHDSGPGNVTVPDLVAAIKLGVK